MRLFALSLLALSALSTPALAQPPMLPDAKTEIPRLESAGTISDISAGAFEKTLWKEAKRSEVLEAITNLPPESPSRSVHDIKRRLLLSQVDTDLIENDVAPDADNNLFILRLKKLEEMGLYTDAIKLYTDYVDTPYNAALAEVGLTLMIHQHGLATACLEEKALKPLFENDEFFLLMENVCAHGLGFAEEPAPDFPGNLVLNTIFSQPDFKFPVMDRAALDKMSQLELAVIKSEDKFDYTTFETTPAALTNLPSRLLMTFLQDDALPEERAEPLKIEAARRGLISIKDLAAYKDMLKLEQAYKVEAYDNETGAKANLWPKLTDTLKSQTSFINETPYAGLIVTAEPKDITQAELDLVLPVLVASGRDIPPVYANALWNSEANQPHDRLIYLALDSLTLVDEMENKAVDNLPKLLGDAADEKAANLLEIMHLYGNDAIEREQIEQIYEKQFSLTGPIHYVMDSRGDADGQQNSAAFQGLGLSLTTSLSDPVLASAQESTSGLLQDAIESLLKSGRSDDARLLGKDVLLGILNKQ